MNYSKYLNESYDDFMHEVQGRLGKRFTVKTRRDVVKYTNILRSRVTDDSEMSLYVYMADFINALNDWVNIEAIETAKSENDVTKIYASLFGGRTANLKRLIKDLIRENEMCVRDWEVYRNKVKICFYGQHYDWANPYIQVSEGDHWVEVIFTNMVEDPE